MIEPRSNRCLHVIDGAPIAVCFGLASTQHWQGGKLRQFVELCSPCAAHMFLVLNRMEIGELYGRP